MSIDYSVRGNGDPLVLIHGLLGTRENLGAIARFLSESFTVYSIDLPNHGRSAHVDTFDLRYIADAIHDWMDTVGLNKAHFFGHSLGGKAAMELALCYPHRVECLIVADIAPVQYGHRHKDVFSGLLSIDLQTLTSRVEADKILSEYVPEKPVRSFLLKNLVKQPSGKFEWRMNLSAIHNHYAELIRGNQAGCFESPVLFLKAENSDYIKPDYREHILSRFPLAELKIVSGTGHWLHAEKPELIAKMVSRFISS